MITGMLNGRYELGEILGYGGMSEVRVARDTLLNRTVAIKILRADLAHDASLLERFRREARNSASLTHPNIVAIFDTGETTTNDGLIAYIVMERLGGETLRNLIAKEGPLDIDRTLRLIALVANALDYSHQMGIVHRDIKPGNIMLVDYAWPKVMDFGISRATDDMQHLTQTATVFGTAQYISPEHAMGRNIDFHADIYSLGCVLFECLTGQPPFQADTPVAVAYKHVQQEAELPSSLRADISPELDQIVATALRKNPEERFASAGDMQEALEKILGEKVAPRIHLPAYQKLGATIAADSNPTEAFTRGDFSETSVLPISVRPLESLAEKNESADEEGAAASSAGSKGGDGSSGPHSAPAPATPGARIAAAAAAGALPGAGAAAAASGAAAGVAARDASSKGDARTTGELPLIEASGRAPISDHSGQVGVAGQVGPNGVQGAGVGAGVGAGAGYMPGMPGFPGAAPGTGQGTGPFSQPGADDAHPAEAVTPGANTKPKRRKARTVFLSLFAVLVLIAGGGGLYYGAVNSGLLNSGSASTLEDYRGRDAHAAYNDLTSKGLKVQIAITYLRTQPHGTVVRTNPINGSNVRRNDNITLYVATGGSPIEVPDVKDMSVKKARTELLLQGIPVESATKKKPSEARLKDKVLGTSITAGSKIQPNQSVQIYVGTGRPPVVVPDVVGKKVEDATRKLEAVKLKVQTKRVKSAKPGGTVVRISGADEELSEGDTVTLFVSDGSLMIMPDITGEYASNAEDILRQAGWRGELTRQRSSTLNIARIGRVARQYPAPGAEVDRDSAVNISVYELSIP